MVEGFRFLPEYFSVAAQRELVGTILAILEDNPVYTATMPRSGKPMSVKMTNLGPLGWVSDINGYRYQAAHPFTNRPWAPIPKVLLDLWDSVGDYAAPPQACLVNWYSADSRLGLHIDADEDAKDAPVVSVSLGSRALFRLGGLERSSPTSSMRLASGDVVVLGGKARRAYHGVDRIYPGTSTMCPGEGGSTSHCAGSLGPHREPWNLRDRKFPRVWNRCEWRKSNAPDLRSGARQIRWR